MFDSSNRLQNRELQKFDPWNDLIYNGFTAQQPVFIVRNLK